MVPTVTPIGAWFLTTQLLIVSRLSQPVVLTKQSNVSSPKNSFRNVSHIVSDSVGYLAGE